LHVKVRARVKLTVAPSNQPTHLHARTPISVIDHAKRLKNLPKKGKKNGAPPRNLKIALVGLRGLE
jgi:hypothetical protein